MPTPSILEASTMEWTYEDFAEELEQLAMLEDLEAPAGPSLSDLSGMLLDPELARLAEDLEQVAELEGR